MFYHPKQIKGILSIDLYHPHYYSPQADWAETFNTLIYIHEDEKEWGVHLGNKIAYYLDVCSKYCPVNILNISLL